LTDNQAEEAVHPGKIFALLYERLKKIWEWEDDQKNFTSEEAAAIATFVDLMSWFHVAYDDLVDYHFPERHDVECHRGLCFEMKGPLRQVNVGLTRWQGGVVVWAEVPLEGLRPQILKEYAVSYDQLNFQTLFTPYDSVVVNTRRMITNYLDAVVYDYMGRPDLKSTRPWAKKTPGK
jgi:hypothetical protein